MFERFTDRARRALVLSVEAARKSQSETVTPYHLLWGDVEAGGVGAMLLKQLGVTMSVFSSSILRPSSTDSEKVLFSSETKKALELSLREALQLNHSYIGTEHILLGLVRIDDPQVRRTLPPGLTLELARSRVMQTLESISEGIAPPESAKHQFQAAPESSESSAPVFNVSGAPTSTAAAIAPEAARALTAIEQFRTSSEFQTATSEHIIAGCLRTLKTGGSQAASQQPVALTISRIGERLWDHLQAGGARNLAAESNELDGPLHTLCAGISNFLDDSQVTLTHVFAAALMGEDFSPAFEALIGCGRAELTLEFIHALEACQVSNLSAWNALLAPDDLALQFVSDLVPVGRRGAWPKPSADLEDKLGFEGYVTMLATMIGRKSTAMPVSIGLFGEWGSGKSYFMQLLRQKVDWLAASGSDQYFEEIAQIHFNAWTYADTNLWASLAAEFFSQLGAPETDPREERRAAIIASLAEHNQIRSEIRTTRDIAAARTRELRAEQKRAARKRETSWTNLDLGLTRKVLLDAQLAGKFGELCKLLGFPQSDRERLLRVADDVTAMASDLAATRTILLQRSMLFPFVLLVALVLLAGIAIVLPAGMWAEIASSGAIASLAALISALGLAVRRSRQSVSGLRQLAVSVRDAREKAIFEDSEMSDLARQLSEAEVNEAAAEVRLIELETAIAQLDRQLVELSPGRQLYQFIAERAASSDYRSQLGVVSSVRHDFEQLVSLMHRWKESLDTSENVPRAFDRIVLYIDDLDRCEPRQVVEVLQAVHLLLAMDLFVVVVGVDPRWLVRSLQICYGNMVGDASQGAEHAMVGLAGSSPHDYLEKIFQVPFSLPDMNGNGFDRLIRFLARCSPKVIEPEGGGDASAPGVNDAMQDYSAAANAPASPEVKSEVAEVLEASRRLGARAIPRTMRSTMTSRELDLLGALAPLVRTPRAATRLFNIYGLLRSARDLSPDGRFLGGPTIPGDFEAVIQLLGIQAGAPNLFRQMLVGDGGRRGLCGLESADRRWSEFVDSLAPKNDIGDGRVNSVSARVSPAAALEWTRVVRHLQRIRGRIRLDELDRYQLWAPQVARFSFFSDSLVSK